MRAGKTALCIHTRISGYKNIAAMERNMDHPDPGKKGHFQHHTKPNSSHRQRRHANSMRRGRIILVKHMHITGRINRAA